MSLYLQRLLERAAALPPRVAGAEPLRVSGSPILTFDQRLASAEMAGDFSILGATPDLPEAAEMAPASARPVARQDRSDAVPTPFPATLEPRTEGPEPLPPTPSARLGPQDPARPEFLTPGRPPDAAPVPPPRSPDTGATEPPSQPGRSRLEPNPPPAPPAAGPSNPDLPSLQSQPRAEPPPAPAAEATPRPIPEEARQPDPAPQTETGPDRSRPDAPEARPLPSVTPVVREIARPAPQPAPAEPRPAAEPVVAAIPPLAPPPRGLSAAEVERMIDEAIGAERDRNAGRDSAIARTRQTQAAAAPGEAPAKRPATAAQVSLIGTLEGSRFRPMLFGVRRR